MTRPHSTRLREPQPLPSVDPDETPSWWRGFWQGAPLWAINGAGAAVLILSALGRLK